MMLHTARCCFILFLCCLCSVYTRGQAAFIIPKPVSVEPVKKKPVVINESTLLNYDSYFAPQAAYLKEQLATQTGILVRSGNSNISSQSVIRLVHDPKRVTRAEAYVLSSGDGLISIMARDVEGMVHGIQSLLQLFPLERKEQATVEAVEIRDHPQFAYRGMHLDVSRHIFPVEFIKKYIEYLAFHKFNSFHWHLTDDQGWRIEIKSYPALTEIGAWRDATLIGHFRDVPARYDSGRYGGFYTQEEVRDVITYAGIRGITIIPEIDIPGHSRAAIAAYPELSTHPDTTWPVAITWGMYNRQNNVLAPNPETFRFLESVFSEIAELFPSPYIHLGGDETSKRWWKESSGTQAFIREKALKDETGLQTYFVNYVASILSAKGKKIVGWHEIMEGRPDPSAIIMNWADEKKALEAVKRKYRVIMTPGKPLYFDHYQSENRDSLSIHGLNTLEMVYLFNPLSRIPADFHSYILGAQANVWTEYMEYPSKVEYMVFPRMTALSEALWTPPSKKNLADFKKRLRENMFRRYEYWGASYYKS